VKNSLGKDYRFADSAEKGCARGFICRFLHAKKRYFIAKDDLKLLTETNDPQALNWLGLCYSRGRYVSKDHDKAMEFIERAASMDCPEAFFNLGEMYLYGNGVPQNRARALQMLEKAAELGNTNALFVLGFCYMNGDSEIKQDKKKALELYQRASDLGNQFAMCGLGQNYETTFGIGNKKKAFELYLRAATVNEEGNPAAFENLARCYEFGIGCTKDEDKAIDYWQKARDCGLFDSAYEAGVRYWNGDGVPEDKSKAVNFVYLAATTIPEAMYEFVIASESKKIVYGGCDIIQLLETAFELGVPEAGFELAIRYRDGKGVTRDKEKAQYYSDKAYEIADDGTKIWFDVKWNKK